MTKHLDGGRPGRGRVYVGLLAWLILALVPALHGHLSPESGAQTDWSCALCAVTSVTEPCGFQADVQATNDVSWTLVPHESIQTAEPFLSAIQDRAPPAPLV